MIRKLSNKDYDDYVELLHQLTKVGVVTTDDFKTFVYGQSTFFEDKGCNCFSKVFVYELQDKVVGCITVLIEQKMAHGFKKVMHIEDVITHKNYRGKNVATKLLVYAKQYAVKNNCYKIILDCNEYNYRFYEKVGFQISGTQMEVRL